MKLPFKIKIYAPKSNSNDYKLNLVPKYYFIKIRSKIYKFPPSIILVSSTHTKMASSSLGLNKCPISSIQIIYFYLFFSVNLIGKEEIKKLTTLVNTIFDNQDAIEFR